ncbi:response regulator transcription factor [Candidatus Woesearchaeota archaeon]|nr:response regulator transcription factor [Candidatus Woesearchaeota archaeon]
MGLIKKIKNIRNSIKKGFDYFINPKDLKPAYAYCYNNRNYCDNYIDWGLCEKIKNIENNIEKKRNKLWEEKEKKYMKEIKTDIENLILNKTNKFEPMVLEKKVNILVRTALKDKNRIREYAEKRGDYLGTRIYPDDKKRNQKTLEQNSLLYFYKQSPNIKGNERDFYRECRNIVKYLRKNPKTAAGNILKNSNLEKLINEGLEAETIVKKSIEEYVKRKKSSLFRKEYYIKQYRNDLASDEMKEEMVEMYRNSGKTLKEISKELTRKYSIHISASTISKYSRKKLKVKNRKEAKNT